MHLVPALCTAAVTAGVTAGSSQSSGPGSSVHRKHGPPPLEFVMNLARKLNDDGGHFLRKQLKVAFVTADGESPTHVLRQGESPELQGHLGTAHANTSLQCSSIRQVIRSQLLVRHSHSDLHTAPAQKSCAPNGTMAETMNAANAAMMSAENFMPTNRDYSGRRWEAGRTC